MLPCLLDLAGYERDDLSRRGQALVHLVLDVGQLGLTIAILWKRLKAYRPRNLGWFETRLLPVQQWLGPVLVAAASFPLLNIVAQQAQVCVLESPPLSHPTCLLAVLTITMHTLIIVNSCTCNSQVGLPCIPVNLQNQYKKANILVWFRYGSQMMATCGHKTWSTPY